jgi:SlyX protein
MADPDLRLTELEIALAHQERLVEDLSDQLREQAERLDRLERRLAAAAARFAELEAGAGGPPQPERPPPHW